MRLSVAALLLAAPALLFVAVPSAQAQVPAVVSPFPRGLSGTIAFQSDMRSPGNPEGRIRIYTINLATGTVTALTNATTWDDEQPQWSPDGSRIAFKSNRNGADNYDLYVMDADGRNLARITSHPAPDHDPSWMPDGESLVFSSGRDSRSDLYRVWLSDLRIVDPSRSTPYQRLTTGAGHDRLPDWRPR